MTKYKPNFEQFYYLIIKHNFLKDNLQNDVLLLIGFTGILKKKLIFTEYMNNIFKYFLAFWPLLAGICLYIKSKNLKLSNICGNKNNKGIVKLNAV